MYSIGTAGVATGLARSVHHGLYLLWGLSEQIPTEVNAMTPIDELTARKICEWLSTRDVELIGWECSVCGNGHMELGQLISAQTVPTPIPPNFGKNQKGQHGQQKIADDPRPPSVTPLTRIY